MRAAFYLSKCGLGGFDIDRFGYHLVGSSSHIRSWAGKAVGTREVPRHGENESKGELHDAKLMADENCEGGCVFEGRKRSRAATGEDRRERDAIEL